MKKYVSVLCLMPPSGKIIPKILIWDNGKQYEITKIKDVRRAASTKAGGAGLRYTCLFGTDERFLFLDEYKWFIEVNE